MSALAVVVAVGACGDDGAPNQPAPSGTKPFVESSGTGPIVNQNPSTPMGNTPGAGSG